MRIGLALPQYGYSADFGWEGARAWARRGAELGFDSFWLSDHVFLEIERYGGPPGRHAILDPLVTLAALARELDTIALGTLVLAPPLRPLPVLANALSALDQVSDGRLTVGVGAGWYPPDFEVAGRPFPSAGERIASLGPVLDELRVLLEGGGDVSPSRQRPHPPLWVGGKGGPRLLDTVARHADGWNTVWVWTPDDYAGRSAALGRACEAAGRDPASVGRSVGLYALAGEDATDLDRRFARMRDRTPPGVLDGVDPAGWREGRLVGTVEEVRAQCRRWRELGVDELIVCPGALPFAVSDIDDLEPLALAITS